jgi:hypothetical protein
MICTKNQQCQLPPPYFVQEVYIWDVCMLTRSDKRKDRVEISGVQVVEVRVGLGLGLGLV